MAYDYAGRVTQGRGKRGSLRWIQTLVNDHPFLLDEAIGFGPIDWRSPLAADDYAEYRDEEFLSLLDLQLRKRALDSFWPARGPQWDALGLGAGGRAILVEAKAHLAEIDSPPTQASGRSLELIERSLAEAAEGLGAVPRKKWTKEYYQYANRLAHGYLVQELNEIPVTVAFVNFVGDSSVCGPASRDEWETKLARIHETLGFEDAMPDFVVECYLDVSGAVPSVV